MTTGEPAIREARKEDLEQAAELVVRLKRLNGEFDPLFDVVDGAAERAVRYISDSMKREGTLILVAAKGSKVLGVLRAEVRERPFYEPSPEGLLTDLYLLPDARRKGLGDLMIKEAWRRLRKMGAVMMTAEVPAQNEIAARFYKKRGFRLLLGHYAREELI